MCNVSSTIQYTVVQPNLTYHSPNLPLSNTFEKTKSMLWLLWEGTTMYSHGDHDWNAIGNSSMHSMCCHCWLSTVQYSTVQYQLLVNVPFHATPINQYHLRQESSQFLQLFPWNLEAFLQIICSSNKNKRSTFCPLQWYRYLWIAAISIVVCIVLVFCRIVSYDVRVCT